jgi:peptidoglycan/LPS O-acetylase OafA/YrhL
MSLSTIPADHSRNNFDLVRLFAAAQVVVVHVVGVMPGLRNDPLLLALSLFPGVPIFFFISGFLIGGSWRRNPSVAAYAAGRALRIFPALWVAGLFTLTMLLLFYTEPMRDNAGTAAFWVLTQFSFLQSWNPQFLRGYGYGVANPVLWTIPVELSFYVVLPLLCLLGLRLRRLRGVLAAAAVLSFVVFYLVINRLDPVDPDVALLRKVFTVSPASFVTWLWMFLLGALAQLEFGRLRQIVSNRFPLFAAIALGVGALSLVVDAPPWLHLPGNEIGLVNALTTSAACLSFAYSYPGLAQRWLRGFDLSYGIYLFHMPIVNALMASGVVGLPGAAIVGAGTLVCAWLSWTQIERRALGHKKRLEAFLSRRTVVNRGVVA